MKERGITRRELINFFSTALTLSLVSNSSILSLAWANQKGRALKMILVDYARCTGCRTCEAVCSAYHNPVKVNGEILQGLGNPVYSRIRVHSFNPNVDVPNVCNMCPDIPCVKACPVEPEPKTGRKAIYRDEKSLTIKIDLGRCIACSSCAKACAEQRTGVIEIEPKTGKPRPLCNLCGGDPQCVKHCPFNALSIVEVKTGRRFYGKPPKKIATELSREWYGVSN